MNDHLKEGFSRIKPICNILIECPSVESVGAYISCVSELRTNQADVVQAFQQYLLHPLITHLKSPKTDKKTELQCQIVDAITIVLSSVTVNNYDMCIKIEVSLLQLVFDRDKEGMIAEVPEELKLSVMKCLTILLLHLEPKDREKLLKTHQPLLGKAIFLCVHIAKLEKLRSLRIAAINSVRAHTLTHERLMTGYQITSPAMERCAVNLQSAILPGVLAALHDVATDNDNPGHLVIVAAIDTMHRILCLSLNNKYLAKTTNVTGDDFSKLIKEKENKEVSNKENSDPKKFIARSPKWFLMAGGKLLLITKSLVSLRTHEHFKVRKELAVFCARLLFECNIAMSTSVPLALDVLISMSRDEYPEVSEYCVNAINTYFQNSTDDNKHKTFEALCENFFATVNTLPRVMNNIDAGHKLSGLNLVHGYVRVLSSGSGLQQLTCALSVSERALALCSALAQAAALDHRLSLLTRHAFADITSAPPTTSPWCKLRNLDEVCERSFIDICLVLGESECADLLLDTLLELFHQSRDAELVYIMNWMCTASNSSEDLIHRILATYIEEDLWYLPLEVRSSEPPLTPRDTLDVAVYNPRSWHKDTVPELYEGATETRYTDISYSAPASSRVVPRGAALTLSDAQRNLLLSCLLTEGLGAIATRLANKFEPFLLKTLCLVLERVGSRYEMLHLSGLKAIHAIAQACGHASVPDLINCNADYFTNQVTVRLKKAWNCQSALQILSVVMKYSDKNILNYLYGIVQDVLVQSCDKYYEKDLYAYLQVFLTFIECIRKWYMIAQRAPSISDEEYLDVLKDTREYLENKEEEEKLLSEIECEKQSSKSAEEMYKEDLKRSEEDDLDYDDNVIVQTQPPPQYVTVTVTILKRCLNYVASSQRDNCILALQVLNCGLPILREQENELLPLVHLTWDPLMSKFHSEPAMFRRAFDLLVTMADLSKDFIRSRATKDVLPGIYKFVCQSAKDSYLKDVGSHYRTGQAYCAQLTALRGLAALVQRLGLTDNALHDALSAVTPYLSCRQPRPLQSSAVEFYQTLLNYDYGAAWLHLRRLCRNEHAAIPPDTPLPLEPVLGTPYLPTDTEYLNNVQLIFS